jgi:hypothetical protein
VGCTSFFDCVHATIARTELTVWYKVVRELTQQQREAAAVKCREGRTGDYMCRSSTDRLHPQRHGSSAVGKPTRDESTSLGQVMHYAYRGY